MEKNDKVFGYSEVFKTWRPIPSMPVFPVDRIIVKDGLGIIFDGTLDEYLEWDKNRDDS